jgi:uncharacterized membrane protein
MESKAKLLGHAIHPMLIVFPLGLLVTSVVFDVIYLVTNDSIFATVAYWTIAAGVIGGVLAAIFGLIDWLGIPAGTRAKAIGLWHGLGNIAVVALFAVSWYLRRDDPAHVPSTEAFIVSLVAVGLGTVTAWLGGELVERLGVGIDHGAHLDAPSSLSGQPADANLKTTRQAAQVETLREEPLREREVGR